MKARKYFEQHRLSVIVGGVIALILVVGLAIIIPLGLRSGPPATTQTPTPATGVATPTASPLRRLRQRHPLVRTPPLLNRE